MKWIKDDLLIQVSLFTCGVLKFGLLSRVKMKCAASQNKYKYLAHV